MFVKLAFSFILLKFSLSMVLDELEMESDDGQKYLLDGFTSHYELSVGISKILASKITNAIALSLPSPVVLQDISNIEYSFLHLIYGLVNEDIAYSNLILEYMSSRMPSSPFISPSLLSKMKLSQKEIYIGAKKVAKGKDEGLIEVPHYIHREFQHLDKSFGLLKIACIEGDIAVVKSFLKNGYSWDSSKHEILKTAWDSSQWDIVRILIEHGILHEGITYDMTTWANKNNETLLHFTAEVVSSITPLSIFSLSNAGVNMNILDINGCSPLCRAISFNNSISTFDALLLKGADINWQSHDKDNLLHIAIKNDNIEVIKLLLRKGSHINDRNRLHLSPLELSDVLGMFSVITELQANSRNINEIDKETSILWALMLNSIFQKYLINGKLNTENLNTSYITKEHLRKQTLIAKLLVEHKAKSEYFSEEKIKMLQLILINGNQSLESINYLCEVMSYGESKKEQSILPLAASKGYLSLVNVLIEKVYDVNIQNSDSKTALYEASFNGHNNLVNYLLNNGANVSLPTDEGLTPLHAAAEKGHEEIVKTLLLHNANVNYRSKSGHTPLHSGVLGDSLLIINNLWQRNASINAIDNFGVTPVKLALDLGRMEIFKYLVEHGAFIKFTSNDSWSLLYRAIENKEIQQVRDLISKGADVNVKNTDGWSILHTAIAEKQLEISKILLESNANVNATNNDGFSVLHLAAEESFLPIVKELINRGAYVNARNSHGWSVLHCGIEGKNLRIVEILLNNGADVNATNMDGWSPLHEAVNTNHLDIAKLLIDRGANTNAKNKDSWTILHFAVENNNLPMVQLLVYGKADVNSKNNDQWSVLQEAVTTGREEIVEFLLKEGVDPNTENADGWTVLHEAASNGDNTLVNTLILYHANVNKSLRNGWSPLHSAAEHGHLNVVMTLVEHCADIFKTADGKNPRNLAHEKGYSTVETFLKEKEIRYEKQLSYRSNIFQNIGDLRPPSENVKKKENKYGQKKKN